MRLVLLLAFWPTGAHAATLDVCPTCTYTTIGAAISAASAGDTITVAAGTYNEAVSLTKDVALVGAGAATTTITSTTNPPLAVSGTTAASIMGFTVEPVDAYDQAVTVVGAVVAFDDLVITDVTGSSYGQCIAISASSAVTLTDSTLTNCDGYAGGAIYVSASALVVEGSTITDSYGTYGGGIFATASSTVSLTDSSFTANSAYDIGGHVYLDNSTLTSTRVAFDKGSSVNNDAGAVYAYLGSWTDTDSTVSNGTTFSCGGAAWLNTTTFTATGTSFTNNTAECGGALRTYYTKVDLTDVTFDGNKTTTTTGGHIHAEGGALTIQGSSFEAGSAATTGGAIYRLYGNTTITDSTFDTHSSTNGGAIYANTPTSFLLDGVTMTASDATAQGGHIYAVSGPLDVVDSEFSYGTSGNAGGIVQAYGSLDVSGSSFADHTATGYGGAIYAYYAPITVADTTFDRNAAPIGSAIYDLGSAMQIDGSRFEGNLAGSYGTVIAESASTMDIADSAFVDNSATAWHGGAHWRYSGGSVARTTFDGNEGGAGGGAVAVYADQDVDVLDCTFSGNNADEGGAIGWYSYTSAVGTLTVRDSTFEGNTADLLDGGALYASDAGDLQMHGNTFSGNSAVGKGGAVGIATTKKVGASQNTFCGNAATDGGAAWMSTITPLADNGWASNVFVENTASAKGGGVYVSAAAGYFWNNDFLGNEAVNGGGVYTDSDLNFQFNVLAWTVAGSGFESTSAVTSATATVLFNDFYLNTATAVAGGITALHATNLEVDPELASYTLGDGCAGDFRLAAGSPLRDAGDPGVLDPDGSTADIGAYGGLYAAEYDKDGDGLYGDSDCDDDDVTVLGETSWYVDADGDGYGGEMSVEACDQPADAYATAEDCDDFDPDVNPIALEACNELDDDCDGTIDEDAFDALTFYADADGDGHGDDSATAAACEAPDGYVSSTDDCDDTAGDVFPGADETCDDRDQDCDGAIDEDPVDGAWYADADGDGFGTGEAVVGCDAPEGHVAASGDCDDAAVGVNPDAEEIVGDGIDQDCDGSDAAPGESTRTWDSPAEDTGEIEATGCGCSGVGGSPAWVAGLLALALTRRRDQS